MGRFHGQGLWLWFVVFLAGGGGGGEQPGSSPLVSEHHPSELTSAPAPNTTPAKLPHVRFDRAKRFVEFDATVVTRESDWLELFVCTPRTREYESILVTPAKPRHIHLALLAIGMKPGRPMRWKRTEKQSSRIPPVAMRWR